MALIPCHECEKPISGDAVACPHCGAANKAASRAQARMLVLVVIVAVLALLASLGVI